MTRAAVCVLQGHRGVSLTKRLLGIVLTALGLESIAIPHLLTGGGSDLDFVLRSSVRCGFTLVELLVVLLIVSIIAAVTLPVVIPAISHRQVGEAARIIQGGLVAARDASLRTNTPHGIRFLPDPTYNGQAPDSTTGNNSTYLSSTKILASNRFIPIEQPPGYSEGKVYIDPHNAGGRPFGGFVNYPAIASGVPGAPSSQVGAGQPNTGTLFQMKRMLMVIQSVYRANAQTMPKQYQVEPSTSWWWNVRAGDKIQINNVGPYFTVVGPVATPNSEMFVNVDPNVPTLQLPDPVKGGYYFPEYLFVVNGEDDDGDGYVDNGWDGVDNDGDGSVDEFDEWAETENWPPAFGLNSLAPANVKGDRYGGVPCTIVRRPVPSPGARETMLPGNAVVDLTSALLARPERSRLPVDRLSGVVDVMVDSGGRLFPTTQYSSPSSFGLLNSFYHIWLTERSSLTEVKLDSMGKPDSWLGSPYDTFYLPMPLGRDAGADGPNAYDELVKLNPTLPFLRGEIRILSLSTRTGSMITTDSPTFDVFNVDQPYRAAQLGLQGETP